MGALSFLIHLHLLTSDQYRRFYDLIDDLSLREDSIKYGSCGRLKLTVEEIEEQIQELCNILSSIIVWFKQRKNKTANLSSIFDDAMRQNALGLQYVLLRSAYKFDVFGSDRNHSVLWDCCEPGI